ncbi:hypothetical protein KFL_015750010, partial [Klebsormidium nitens]
MYAGGGWGGGLLAGHDGPCLNNHDLEAGAPVHDGCQAFVPKRHAGLEPPEDVCDACGCHRAYHQKTGSAQAQQPPPIGGAKKGLFERSSGFRPPPLTLARAKGSTAMDNSEDDDPMAHLLPHLAARRAQKRSLEEEGPALDVGGEEARAPRRSGGVAIGGGEHICGRGELADVRAVEESMFKAAVEESTRASKAEAAHGKSEPQRVSPK